MNLLEKIKAKLIEIRDWFKIERNLEIFGIGAFIILAPMVAFLTGSKIQDFGFQNIFHGLPQFLIILAAIVVSIVMVAREINPGVKLDKNFVKDMMRYWGWGGVQQIALVSCFFILINILIPFGVSWWWCAILAACVFSYGFHRPNMFLVQATFMLGIVNMMFFHDFGNIYVLAILHGTAGTLLERFMPRALQTGFSIMSQARLAQLELNNRLK